MAQIYNVATQLVIQGVDTASLNRAMSTISGQMSKATTQAKSFTDAIALRGVNLAGYTVIGSAVVKITEAISRATSDAIRFEYELAKIAQTVQQSNSAINKHADSIRNMSVAYGLSAPKIAETIRVLAQAGYSFTEAKAAADSLAQTTLLASFESIADTTDGLIAINKQFVETMGDSQRVLSVLNTVSKQYAVESSDLVEAVRKAGGTFAATGGKMEELVTVFTTVRDTTRESSETIATGLRTIFSRLQRPKTIDFLRQYGIELTDLRGNFIGNYEAIQRIQSGLDKAGVKAGSIKFAGVVEEIGGIRQQSRVIPLLTQAAKMQRIYADTQTAAADTALDLAKAQETLSFKLSQTQQNFSKLIGDITGTDKFKELIGLFLSVANAAIHFSSALKDLIPLITSLLALKVGSSFAKVLGKGPAGAILGVGGGRGFARGGFVPGSGSGDTVPAMLTPGEFVIRKSAAQAFGADNLHKINRYGGGKEAKQAKPRIQSAKELGLEASHLDEGYTANLKKGKKTFIGQALDNFTIMLNAETNQKLKKGNAGVLGRELRAEISGRRSDMLFGTQLKTIKTRGGAGNFVGGKNSAAYSLLDANKEALKNSILRAIKNPKKYHDPLTDLLNALKSKINQIDKSGHLMGGMDQVRELRLADRSLGDNADVFNEPRNASRSRATVRNAEKDILTRDVETHAFGGSVGTAGTDTVPALLTPGEFVVNKKSAQAFGYGNLHKVNKYAAGGAVQHFADGGLAGGGVLAGLEGFGELSLVVNNLIPKAAGLATAFATISIQTYVVKQGFQAIGAAATGIVKFFQDFAANSAASAAELEKVKQDEYNAYRDATKTIREYDDNLAAGAAAAAIAKGGGSSVFATTAQRTDDADRAFVAAKSSVAGRPNVTLNPEQELDANTKLTKARLALALEFGRHSAEVRKATKLEQSLNSATDPYNKNLQAAADAVEEYTKLVLAGGVQQALLTKSQQAAKDAADKTVAASKFAPPTPPTSSGPGLISRGWSSVKRGWSSVERGASATANFLSTNNGLTRGLETAATGGLAIFVTSLTNAANAASKLSTDAIAAGNSQGAYDASLEASQKQREASDIQTGASTGAAIGSLFGPLGTAIGTVVGAFVGWTGGITAFTDLIGVSNSAVEAETKAREAATEAALIGVEKRSSDSLNKSAELRRVDPNAANEELVKGIFATKADNLADNKYASKDIQPKLKSQYEAASSAIADLSKKPENLGRSFEELRARNVALFSAWDEAGGQVQGNTELMKAEAEAHNANAFIIREEATARLDSIRSQLEIIAIQDKLAISLSGFDQSLADQSRTISNLDYALGGDAPTAKIGTSLTDLSTRNVSNPKFAQGLDEVAKLGPEFEAQANSVRKVVTNIDGLAETIVALRNEKDAGKQGDIQRTIQNSLDATGLDKKAKDEIMGQIVDKEGNVKEGDPVDIEKSVMEKFVNPLADSLEAGRNAINSALEGEASILSKQVALDKKRLDSTISILKGEQQIEEKINSLLGKIKDPADDKADRVSLASETLRNTRFANQVGSGGADAITSLGRELQLNARKEKQLADRIQTTGDFQEGKKLQEELSALREESAILNDAMSHLSEVTDENSAIEARLAESQQARGAVRDAANGLAFGDTASRKEFFKTLRDSRIVAGTGSAENIKESDRGSTLSFLERFKNVRAFGGRTGKETIDRATANFLVNQLGVPVANVGEVMDDFVASELQMIDVIRANLRLDQDRNDILRGILNNQVNARGAPPAPGPVQFASGGGIDWSPKGTDTVPAMLTPGEFVIKKAAVDQYGSNFLNDVNSQKLASGGAVQYLARGGQVEIPKQNIYSGETLRSIWKQSLERPNIANSVKFPFNNVPNAGGPQNILLGAGLNIGEIDTFGDVFRQLRRKGGSLQDSQNAYRNIVDSVSKFPLPVIKKDAFRTWDQFREVFFGGLNPTTPGELAGIKVDGEGKILQGQFGVVRDAGGTGRIDTTKLPLNARLGPGIGKGIANFQETILNLLKWDADLGFDRIFPNYDIQLKAFEQAVIANHNILPILAAEGGEVGYYEEGGVSRYAKYAGKSKRKKYKSPSRKGSEAKKTADMERAKKNKINADRVRESTGYNDTKIVDGKTVRYVGLREERKLAASNRLSVFESNQRDTILRREEREADYRRGFLRKRLPGQGGLLPPSPPPVGGGSMLPPPPPPDDGKNPPVTPLPSFIIEGLEKKSKTGGVGTGFFANGGAVGTDTVPAMLTPGEFVIKKAAVDQYGAGLLSDINTQKFAAGGQVGDSLKGRKLASDKDPRRPNDLPYYSGLQELASNFEKREAFRLGQIPDMANTLEEQKQFDADKFPTLAYGLPQLSDSFKIPPSEAEIEKQQVDRKEKEALDKAKRANFVQQEVLVMLINGRDPRTEKGVDPEFIEATNYIYKLMGPEYFDNKIATGKDRKFRKQERERLVQEDRTHILAEIKEHLRDKPWYQDVYESIVGAPQNIKDVMNPEELYKRMEDALPSNRPENAESKKLMDQQTEYEKFQERKGYGDLFNPKREAFANGGAVGTDTVPAMLTPGEFIMSKSSVAKHGLGMMQRLNSGGEVRYLKTGGQPIDNGFNSTKPIVKSESGDKASGPVIDFKPLGKFNNDFLDNINKLDGVMKQKFQISLAPQSIAVNLFGAEFIAQLPQIMQSIIWDRIQQEIGKISDAVKKNFSAGR